MNDFVIRFLNKSEVESYLLVKIHQYSLDLQAKVNKTLIFLTFGNVFQYPWMNEKLP